MHGLRQQLTTWEAQARLMRKRIELGYDAEEARQKLAEAEARIASLRELSAARVLPFATALRRAKG